MKLPDLKDKNLTFPINIPLRISYVFRPAKRLPTIPMHDYLNFKQMTGNEILLYLENPQNLRLSEFASALNELIKKAGASEKDWANHPWIQNCAKWATEKSSNLSRVDVGILVKVFEFIKYEDEKLWANLAAASNKMLQLLRGKSYSTVFNHYLLHPTHSTSDFRSRLIEMLPVKLYKMPRDDITRCFATCVKLGLLNEYLWDKHFQRIFANRVHWFGPKNYKVIVDNLITTEFGNDVQWLSKEFLPFINNMLVRMTEEEANGLIECLNNARDKLPELETEDLINTLNHHISYTLKMQKTMEDNRLWNIVKSDLEYYKEKEKIKLQRESASQ
eukprot:CAMPEP_0176419880 /NCGR_PEP_ID=MMETSP0127-20121128/8299_1 /TAXON_ID=938130 /ORGANISM="Platyophrya macrostoma, Strain WH" /LENGTH=331 /DNA_ID=CAMNT_0017800419 /DNA_START=151 /DNA_END=1146 /DNA_ORIENTATION=-